MEDGDVGVFFLGLKRWIVDGGERCEEDREKYGNRGKYPGP